MPITRLRGAAILLAAAVCTGCGGDAAGRPSLTREVRGDTTIIRISGAAAVETATEEVRIGQLEGPDEYTFGDIRGIAIADDGSMYVLDGQALNIRVYARNGTYMRTFGRGGEGPGELKQPGGMVFLSDGRLVVRDPGNARINVYTAQGESLTTWPIPGGFFTSEPLFRDAHDNVYTDVIAERMTDGFWRVGLLRLSNTGEHGDTLMRPFHDFETPRLVAERREGSNRSMSASGVPFWPRAMSALNHNGEFVGGISDQYAILVWRADSTILRIERDIPPVAVDAAERDAAVERITRNMRNLDPSWRWDGPQPPEYKPPYTQIQIGDDDRIWVRLSQPAVRVPPDPDAEPDAQGRPPVDRWVEPMVFEVFEPDGEFVGAVRLPERFSPMVMRGPFVYGVLRDEYDVEYVARLRAFPVTPGASRDEVAD